MEMTTPLPEAWLRGPIDGIPQLLQPAAHAFVLAREDVAAATSGLTLDQIWQRPNGITPIGFHLAHLAGSTGRLLAYAKGAPLTVERILAWADELGLRPATIRVRKFRSEPDGPPLEIYDHPTYYDEGLLTDEEREDRFRRWRELGAPGRVLLEPPQLGGCLRCIKRVL